MRHFQKAVALDAIAIPAINRVDLQEQHWPAAVDGPLRGLH